jgi:tetratricopeptide (TPR) repeat protein
MNLAISLANLAYMAQIPIGELDAAESNLRRSIKICREINNYITEVVDHQELGLLHIYLGEFEEAEKELSKSTKYWKEINNKQGICVNEAYHTLHSLLMSNAEEAFKSAKKAREMADVEHFERDIIQDRSISPR